MKGSEHLHPQEDENIGVLSVNRESGQLHFVVCRQFPQKLCSCISVFHDDTQSGTRICVFTVDIGYADMMLYWIYDDIHMMEEHNYIVKWIKEGPRSENGGNKRHRENYRAGMLTWRAASLRDIGGFRRSYGKYF